MVLSGGGRLPKRTNHKTGSELFIVDNSDDEWKALRYLTDWCSLSKAIDIATAYFEIGSLLALDREWQKVDQLRVLMGDEVSKRTKAAITKALSDRVARLDASIEAEKEKDDFLEGVPAIVDAIKTGKIKFRIFRKEKFHAKAYITHARMDVIGSAALVGSSNFTRPGLTQNVELNVQITGQPVSVLQDWYEDHWNEAEDVTADILRTIERHIENFSPFEIYAHSLREYFRRRDLTAGDWEKNESVIWKMLDGYQKEGYGAVLKIARQYGGAFLCDGVGLGKTFVGLMLLERLVRFERKKVLLLVPKSGRETVWEANLDKFLPDLTDGVFSNLQILNHTDLSSEKYDRVLAQIAQQADAIIVDEAHNFRNPGIAGRGERRPSRYRKLQEIAAGKELYLLTATPVNNSVFDLMHMIALFAGNGEKLSQAPLGVHSLQGHFRVLEKRIKQANDPADTDADVLDDIDETVVQPAAFDVFSSDPIVRELVVQRSRAYVKESQKKEARGQAVFPVRDDPQVGAYALSKRQSSLLDLVEKAFSKSQPLFSLPIYYPQPWARQREEKEDFATGRQRQVVRLIRTGFLKRLESSTAAFDFSCQNLLIKLLAFAEKHSETKGQKDRLARWRGQHEETLTYVRVLISARN